MQKFLILYRENKTITSCLLFSIIFILFLQFFGFFYFTKYGFNIFRADLGLFNFFGFLSLCILYFSILLDLSISICNILDEYGCKGKCPEHKWFFLYILVLPLISLLNIYFILINSILKDERYMILCKKVIEDIWRLEKNKTIRSITYMNKIFNRKILFSDVFLCNSVFILMRLEGMYSYALRKKLSQKDFSNEYISGTLDLSILNKIRERAIIQKNSSSWQTGPSTKKLKL